MYLLIGILGPSNYGSLLPFHASDTFCAENLFQITLLLYLHQTNYKFCVPDSFNVSSKNFQTLVNRKIICSLMKDFKRKLFRCSNKNLINVTKKQELELGPNSPDTGLHFKIILSPFSLYPTPISKQETEFKMAGKFYYSKF